MLLKFVQKFYADLSPSNNFKQHFLFFLAFMVQ